MARARATIKPQDFVRNAASDIPDLRDHQYEPALVRLPKSIVPERKHLEIRHQGSEGACTGFAITAAVDLLNARQGRGRVKVSPRMLYEMAKRFDEWTGEDYPGSSLRGAIRGWWHNGVCGEKDWPYDDAGEDHQLTVARANAARTNALGAYYRLSPNLNHFHAALTEAGVLCVSARVHGGWFKPKSGRIERGESLSGGHAFAIVGYDSDGFLIQNSWGETWGNGGLAVWPYEDWAENLMDAWVFRLALPLPDVFDLRAGYSTNDPAGRAQWFGAPRRSEIAGHFVHVDDGRFHERGRYHSNAADIAETADRFASSARGYKHLLVYAHGGLNSPKSSAKRIRAMKEVFKDNNIYPLHFMYDTGLAEELKDVILGKSDRAEKRVGSIFDRSDKIVETLARKPGTIIWNEMKNGAFQAFEPGFAGEQVLRILAPALKARGAKVHLLGHSTGAVLLAHLLRALDDIADWEAPIASCSLLAPACTVELYREVYMPRLGPSATAAVRLPKLQIYNLTDQQEKDDTVTPLYRKSLLYLVSNAFEGEQGKALLGMRKFAKRLRPKPGLKIFYSGEGSRPRTRSKVHGGFDNDPTTLNDILAAALGSGNVVRRFTDKDLDY